MLGVRSAEATPYGTEITVYDGTSPDGSGIAKEDNAVENGMVQSQAWDLEGFFLQGRDLTIAGGYNFYTGKDGIDAGDIFIDTNGDAVYSPAMITGITTGYQLVENSKFKYDYVLDINWTKGTFDLVKLTLDSILKDTMYGSQYNIPSNPWIYVSGGTSIGGGNFNTYGKVSQSNTGFRGWEGTDGADKK